MKLILTDVDFNHFNELLEQHCGMHYDRSRAYLLEDALKQSIDRLKFRNPDEYYQFLKYRDKGEELDRLVQLLTIGETYFFRTLPHFNALKNHILPPLVVSGSTVRFLSAACSTGEEPYSIALLMTEHFPHIKCQITGVDINPGSLNRARKAEYETRAIKQMPIEYLKYFNQIGHTRFEIKHPLQYRISWLEGNLRDETLYSKIGGFDVIFCRNVLIYFSLESIRFIINKFHSILNPGGYLILGHAESLRDISTDFENMEHSDTFFYRKAVIVPDNKPSLTLNTLNTPNRFEQSRVMFPEMVRASTPNDSRPFPVFQEEPQTDSNRKSAPLASQTTPDADYQRGMEWLKQENTLEASMIFEQLLHRNPVHTGALTALALIFAGNGQFNRALEACNKVLENDEFSVEALYLKGLVHEQKQEWETAIKAYQTVIFLNQGFSLAHFHLAGIYSRQKLEREARRSYQNALNYLDRDQELYFQLYSGGLSRQTLKNLCLQNLATA
ncbi:MAG: tetratricopeptide repeat protein [SAR324 cluster bacterium]|nr:tetratricopeptide repeat protein [SAR324 cluster bacterium]